jgi:putative hydrolase of the HAD superfamily
MISVITALIFDLDDTLVVEECSAEAAFIESGLLAQERYGLDPRELHATLRKTCREIWYAFPSHPYCKRVGISSWEGMWAEFIGPGPDLKSLHDWAPEYRRESWYEALKRHKIDDLELAITLAETFPRLRRSKNVLYPDTLAALQTLSGKYVFGLITNGASDLQRTKIKGAGIGEYFDEILISGDFGFGKPDARLFTILLERLQVSAGRALMIGNSLATDIQGAHNAGIRTAWINRSMSIRDAAIIPDWEISSLMELPLILENAVSQ